MPTFEEVKAHIVALNYNMIDADMVARAYVANPDKEYKALKVLSHKALHDGKLAMQKGDNDKANKNFAFAYQTRCVADNVWTKLLKKKGDESHAAYVEIQRDFSKLALGRISPDDIAKITKRVEAIKE